MTEEQHWQCQCGQKYASYAAHCVLCGELAPEDSMTTQQAAQIRERAEEKPMKFRKKSVVIEAFQLTEELAKASILDKIPLPFGLSIGNYRCHPERREVYDWHLYIPTLEGRMEAKQDDWIIKGIKNELYPCKPDIFAATYEAE